jgi:hypothetical protein
VRTRISRRELRKQRMFVHTPARALSLSFSLSNLSVFNHPACSAHAVTTDQLLVSCGMTLDELVLAATQRVLVEFPAIGADKQPLAGAFITLQVRAMLRVDE